MNREKTRWSPPITAALCLLIFGLLSSGGCGKSPEDASAGAPAAGNAAAAAAAPTAPAAAAAGTTVASQAMTPSDASNPSAMRYKQLEAGSKQAPGSHTSQLVK